MDTPCVLSAMAKGLSCGVGLLPDAETSGKLLVKAIAAADCRVFCRAILIGSVGFLDEPCP